MKAKDYMFLPKKRLAELLEEKDNLEEKIEDLIAEKFAELLSKLPTQSPIQTPPLTPNPFNQPIPVLYGCPTDLDPIVYSKGETTSISKNNRTMSQNVIYLERGVEYYPDEDTVLLIRCPKCGRENYALSVYDGVCCWCGFNGRELLKQE